MKLLRTIGLAAGACIAAAAALAPQSAQAESGGWSLWRSNAVTGSGTLASETRTATDFEAISVSGSINLKLRQTGREALELRADDNLLPLLETVVEPTPRGRTLLVRWKRGQSVQTRSPVTVTVDVARLTALSGAGSGAIVVEALNTPKLTLTIEGSGDALLHGLNAGELGVRIAGSGDVKGDGQATRLGVSIAGSGDVNLGGLRADEVSVSIAGSGAVLVQAHKTLDVSIAGSGDVTYSGAALVKTSVAGSGRVTKR